MSEDHLNEKFANHDARLKTIETELASLRERGHDHSNMLHTHDALLGHLRDDFEKYSKRIEKAIGSLNDSLMSLDRGLQLVNNFKYKIIGAVIVMGPITGSIIAFIVKSVK
jgi:predicted  nucleic acid-binding Zn-ribbon protein